MPLAVIGLLALIRPRWAAWALAITALIVGFSASYPIDMVYAIPALLAAGLLRAAIPKVHRP